MGIGCDPHDLAATAFETLAGQLEAVSGLAERDESYDAWRIIENIPNA